jgi:hypothetical protein
MKVLRMVVEPRVLESIQRGPSMDERFLVFKREVARLLHKHKIICGSDRRSFFRGLVGYPPLAA